MDYACQPPKLPLYESLPLIGILSIFIYVLLIVCFRILGKKGLSDLNIADLVLLIIIGESIGAIIPNENAFYHAVIVIISLFVANFLIDWLSFNYPWFKKKLEGSPVDLIENGSINKANLKNEKLTEADLKEALRINGMNDDLSKLQKDLFGVLETDGKISIFHRN